MAKIAVAAAVAMLLAGCATQQQEQEARTLDIGPPPAVEVWQASVRAAFLENLKDPESGRFRMGCLVRGYMKNALLAGRSGMEYQGWMARVEVNAKNSFGGYTGFKPYIVFVRADGSMSSYMEPLSRGGWDHPRLYLVDRPSCEVPVAVNF